MSRYARINSSLWLSSRKWRQVQDDAARLLYFYLHTCPHSRGTGCYVLPLPYAMADLGWPKDKVSTALTALSDCGLIVWDETEHIVYCTGAARQDPPRNPSQAQGHISDLDSIPDCLPKLLCQQELVAVLSENPKIAIACREGIERVSRLCRDSLYTVSTQSAESVDTVLSQCGDLSGSGSGSGSGVVAVPVSLTTALGAALKQLGAVGIPFLEFPTVGTNGSTWTLTQAQVDQWATLFPSLDVAQQCRHALAWIETNASKRKTSRGMARFLAGWLTRATDRPSTSRADDLSGLEALRQETADR